MFRTDVYLNGIAVSCINYTATSFPNWAPVSVSSPISGSSTTIGLTVYDETSAYSWSSLTAGFWISSYYTLSNYYTFTNTENDGYCSKFLTAVPSDVTYDASVNIGTVMTTSFSAQTCDGVTLPVTSIDNPDGSSISDPYISVSGNTLSINFSNINNYYVYIGVMGIRLHVNYYNQTSSIYAYVYIHFINSGITYNPTSPNHDLSTCKMNIYPWAFGQAG